MRMLCLAIITMVCIGCAPQALIVKKVLSADTIMLNDGTKVRYAGVVSPQPKDDWFEACRVANEFLVLNHKVSLVKEPKLSNDNIVTAYVYTPINDKDKTKQLFVNAEMLKFGYGKCTENSDGFEKKALWNNLKQMEEEAKQYQVGVWSNKPPQIPQN